MNDHRLKILKQQEDAGKIRVARYEYYCPHHKRWHGVGFSGKRDTLKFRGNELRDTVLDHAANATIFGCLVARKNNADCKKRYHEKIAKRDKKLISEMPVKFVIDETRFMTLVFSLVNKQPMQHREELLSRCNFALVKAARRYETIGRNAESFGTYAKATLKYVITNYFYELAKFPTVEFDDARTSERNL